MHWVNDFCSSGGVFMMLLFWLPFLFLFFWLFTGKKGDWFGKTENEPLEILKKRYAKGEIDKKEYEEKKKELEKKE